jgi:hypothetical protein
LALRVDCDEGASDPIGVAVSSSKLLATFASVGASGVATLFVDGSNDAAVTFDVGGDDAEVRNWAASTTTAPATSVNGTPCPFADEAVVEVLAISFGPRVTSSTGSDEVESMPVSRAPPVVDAALD